MIIYFLINVIVQFVMSVISLLPTAGILPTNMTDWVGYFIEGAQLIGFILPLSTLATIIGLVLGIELILIFYKVGMTIFRMIRG